jgi:hypothetical protein
MVSAEANTAQHNNTTDPINPISLICISFKKRYYTPLSPATTNKTNPKYNQINYSKGSPAVFAKNDNIRCASDLIPIDDKGHSNKTEG